MQKARLPLTIIGTLAIVAGAAVGAAASEDLGAATRGLEVRDAAPGSSDCVAVMAVVTGTESLTLSEQTFYDDPTFGDKPRFAIEWDEPLFNVVYADPAIGDTPRFAVEWEAPLARVVYADPQIGEKPRFAIEWEVPLPAVLYDERLYVPAPELRVGCEPSAVKITVDPTDLTSAAIESE